MITVLETPEQRRAFFKCPPILYKYCAPSLIKNVLKDHTLRYSFPSEFNDIFDSTSSHGDGVLELNPIGASIYFLQLPIDDYEKFSRDILRPWLQRCVDEFPGFTVDEVVCIPPGLSHAALEDYVRGFIGGQDLSSEEIVLSLSYEALDNVMWALYAEKSTGFCIGFKSSARLFQGKSHSNLHRVIYTDRPPEGDFRITRRRRFLLKEARFSFENEWRSIVHKSAAKPKLGDPPILLRTFDPDDIDSIIFGSRASDELIKEGSQYAPKNARLFKCFPLTGTYKLELRPLD